MTSTPEARRAEYEAIVKGPGKFEQENPWCPYFWEMGLDGMADEDDGRMFTFVVEPCDVAIFPELKVGQKIHLLEDDCGFVREL